MEHNREFVNVRSDCWKRDKLSLAGNIFDASRRVTLNFSVFHNPSERLADFRECLLLWNESNDDKMNLSDDSTLLEGHAHLCMTFATMWYLTNRSVSSVDLRRPGDPELGKGVFARIQ